MSSYLFLIIVLIYIINTCNAVQFKVICTPNEYGGTGVNVNIDGTPHPMTAQPNDILYELNYEGTPNHYFYEIVGNQTMSESILFNGVQREWDPQSTTTLYEVYGRRNTIADDKIKTIPRLFKPLEGYDKYSQLFQEGEIPVFHVKMNATQYDLLTSTTDSVAYPGQAKTTIDKYAKYIVEFDLYTPYEKYHFTNVTFGLSGQGSREMDKKPYKIDLSEGDANKSNTEIFNRKEFKLRSLRYDESYIKNKLASDIAESLGLPITQASFCRLYINGKSYGLYELTDMYKKKFIRRFFNPDHNGDETVYGSLYKGNSGDFPAYLYKDFPGSKQTFDQDIARLYNSEIAPTNGDDLYKDIKTMIDWVYTITPTTPLAEIEKQFDVDMFLKFMVIEYLICHKDGYLGNGNNFFIYVKPNNEKYYFFSYDFDLTFGKWCHAKEGTIDNYVLHVCDPSDPNKPPPPYGSEAKKRDPFLYTQIINHPEIRPKFDQLVKDIVQNLFNLNALGPRIDYFYEFLRDDMYWDIDNFALNTFDTKYFNKEEHEQELPDKAKTDAQYNELDADTENLKSFIKYKSENIAQIFNIQLQSKGEFGEVGGKLITIGKAKNDKNNSDTTTTSSSPIRINKSFSTLLLITIISILSVFF